MSEGELLSRKLRSSPEVHFRAFGDELVLLDLARGEYFSLDALGARIWLEILEGRTAGQIAELLLADYDTDLQRLQLDVLALLDELLRRGLLSPSS